MGQPCDDDAAQRHRRAPGIEARADPDRQPARGEHEDEHAEQDGEPLTRQDYGAEFDGVHAAAPARARDSSTSAGAVSPLRGGVAGAGDSSTAAGPISPIRRVLAGSEAEASRKIIVGGPTTPKVSSRSVVAGVVWVTSTSIRRASCSAVWTSTAAKTVRSMTLQLTHQSAVK